MTTEQEQIDLEIEAIKILHNMVFFSTLGIGFKTNTNSMEWLTKRHYIAKYRSQYIITDDGRTYYREVSSQTKIRANIERWKDEALTGLKELTDPVSKFRVSAPSEIENACIPRTRSNIHGDNNPEKEIIKRQRQRNNIGKIAKELNLEIIEVCNFMNEGRIKMCRNGHVGLFDKKGKGYQHLCRQCSKEIRKS